MVSVASGGRADRIAARILFKVPRAGSGTPARYSSILFGGSPALAADLRVVDLACFMRTMLQPLPLQIHDVGARKGSGERVGCEFLNHQVVPGRRKQWSINLSKPRRTSSLRGQGTDRPGPQPISAN